MAVFGNPALLELTRDSSAKFPAQKTQGVDVFIILLSAYSQTFGDIGPCIPEPLAAAFQPTGCYRRVCPALSYF